MTEFKIQIKRHQADENTWRTVSDQSVYDAIHAVAGALLGGAQEVRVVRNA